MLFVRVLISLCLNVLLVQASLRVTMHQLPDETIRVIVTNQGDEDIEILKHPNSVLRTSQPTHKFTFTSVEGSRLPMFIGNQVSWNPHVASKIDDAYVTIPAYMSIYFDHDLLAAYSFSDSGRPYERFTITVVESSFLTSETIIHFPAPVLTITISSRHHRAMRNLQKPFSKAGWSSCNALQQKSLTRSTTEAQELSSDALVYFENPPSRSVRYPTWFGASNSVRDIFVSGCLSSLRDLSFESYSCGGRQCESDIIAYTFPSQPDWGVFVCDRYWDQPDRGRDSKAGTLVHEASHLLCGTDDNCYEQSTCQNLAEQDPDVAVGTASSYMYFVENTPHLY